MMRKSSSKGTQLDSNNSPMYDGDWITSQNGLYTLKLISGELTVIDSHNEATPGLGNGPHYAGDICTMTPGGNLVIGPMSNWRSHTRSAGAKLRIDDDGVPRIHDIFGNIVPIRPQLVMPSKLRVVGATIVEVGKMLQATGLGLIRVANQLKDGDAFFADETRARIGESPNGSVKGAAAEAE